jgi:hypothetical protein
MLIEIFVLFEIVTLVVFFIAFFTHQEILWALSLVLAGTMMYTSWSVEYYIYEWNATISAYSPVIISHSYPYLMALNLLILALALLLGIFDMFDKYGSNFAGRLPRIIKK